MKSIEVQFQESQCARRRCGKGSEGRTSTKRCKLNSLSSLEIYYQPENLSGFYVAKKRRHFYF